MLFALLGGCDVPPTTDETLQTNTATYRTLIFHLDEKTTLERVVRFDQDSLVFFNHTERIAVPYTNNASLRADFTLYRSAIVLNSTLDSGHWEIYDRDTSYRFPLSVQHTDPYVVPGHRIVPDTLVYAIAFNPETDQQYPAIGRFLRSGDYLSGTFQTETGDFRFLEGAFINDTSAFLTCFDGSHLFHFSLRCVDDSITGIFSSGSHYRSAFQGVLDFQAELSDPFSLTQVIDPSPISLEVLTTEGDHLILDTALLQDKITVLQLMGTWCPNCFDESNYLRDLYKRHYDARIQIIALAYERAEEPQAALPRLAHYRQKLRLQYPIYLAGKASKAMASQQFPMLNGITSFPTTIVIGPDASIRFTHTGFNGPGTGDAFTQFTRRFESQLHALLSEFETELVR